MKELDYTFPIYSEGVLSPDKLAFFYYDIMRDTIDYNQGVYDWNDDIQNFLDNKGIVIEEKPNGTLPNKVEKNGLYFTVCEDDKDNKAIAFFRHLRNAFAHFGIASEGEYLKLEDFGSKRTMIGLVKYEDLKELCFLFFKQKEVSEEKHEPKNG